MATLLKSVGIRGPNHKASTQEFKNIKSYSFMNIKHTHVSYNFAHFWYIFWLIILQHFHSSSRAYAVRIHLSMNLDLVYVALCDGNIGIVVCAAFLTCISESILCIFCFHQSRTSS